MAQTQGSFYVTSFGFVFVRLFLISCPDQVVRSSFKPALWKEEHKPCILNQFKNDKFHKKRMISQPKYRCMLPSKTKYASPLLLSFFFSKYCCQFSVLNVVHVCAVDQVGTCWAGHRSRCGLCIPGRAGTGPASALRGSLGPSVLFPRLNRGDTTTWASPRDLKLKCVRITNRQNFLLQYHCKITSYFYISIL